MIEDYQPKTENLTVAVGEKLIPPGTKTIDEELLDKLPAVRDIVDKIVEKQPDVIIPIGQEDKEILDIREALLDSDKPTPIITVGPAHAPSKIKPLVVANVSDISKEVEIAVKCDFVMEPEGQVRNLKQKIIIFLPNNIQDFRNVENFVTHMKELAPTQPIILGMSNNTVYRRYVHTYGMSVHTVCPYIRYVRIN